MEKNTSILYESLEDQEHCYSVLFCIVCAKALEQVTSQNIVIFFCHLSSLRQIIIPETHVHKCLPTMCLAGKRS